MVDFSKLYIFIYVMLLIGCNSQSIVCDNGYLEMSAPNLQIDENGYYHIEVLSDYYQTYTTLDVETGLEYEKVGWATDVQYNIEYMGTDNWTYLVNTSSYTDDEGIAHTVLGVWEDFVGDTIKVYCGYVDNCQITYFDSLGVVVE